MPGVIWLQYIVIMYGHIFNRVNQEHIFVTPFVHLFFSLLRNAMDNEM